MNHFDQTITASVDELGWPLYGLVRLAVAALCGGLVGLEREIRGRQAGFRTNVLVCVGCAVVMLVSTRMAFVDWPDHSGVTVDPARIAYGVMAGFGFLGAGVIIRHKATVRGLTTAAGIWCVAGIGLACGLGLYVFAGMATVVVVAVLWLLDLFDLFERVLPRTHDRNVVIRRPWEVECVGRTVRLLRDAGYKVPDWSFERVGDLDQVDITLVVGFHSKTRFDLLGEHLPEAAGVEVLAVKEG